MRNGRTLTQAKSARDEDALHVGVGISVMTYRLIRYLIFRTSVRTAVQTCEVIEMLTREYMEQEKIDCLRTIARELTRIRELMEERKQRHIPDLETFIEQQEDDRK